MQNVTNETMLWGFFNAVDGYFWGGKDPKKFYDAVNKSGFLPSWGWEKKQSKIAKLAIKKKFDIVDKSNTSPSTVQSFFNALMAVYKQEWYK
jgi:hypothetical protein